METYLTYIIVGRLMFLNILRVPTLNEGNAINYAWRDWLNE